MSKNIYIHIGWHRTGTTSLQLFLAKNKVLLEGEYKIYYPAIGMLEFAHHPIAWSLKGINNSLWGVIEGQAGNTEEYIRRIIEGMDNSQCNSAIISSEEFCVLDLHEISLLYSAIKNNGLNAIIVVYVRRPDEYVESAYNMKVKWWGDRFTGDFNEFLFQVESSLNKLVDRLGQWADMFGKDNIVVREYSRNTMKEGDTRVDFCSILGIDWRRFEFDEIWNESLGPRSIEFMRIINNLEMPNDLHYRIEQRLHKRKEEKAVFFTSKQRSEFLQECEPLLSRLRQYNKNLAFDVDPNNFPERNVKPLTIHEFATMFDEIARLSL